MSEGTRRAVVTMVVFGLVAIIMLLLAAPTVVQPSSNNNDSRAAIVHFRNVLQGTDRDSLTVPQLKDTLIKLGKTTEARCLGWQGDRLDSLLHSYALLLARIWSDDILNNLRALSYGGDTARFYQAFSGRSLQIAHLRIETSLASLKRTLPPDDSLFPTTCWTIYNRWREHRLVGP